MRPDFIQLLTADEAIEGKSQFRTTDKVVSEPERWLDLRADSCECIRLYVGPMSLIVRDQSGRRYDGFVTTLKKDSHKGVNYGVRSTPNVGLSLSRRQESQPFLLYVTKHQRYYGW